MCSWFCLMSCVESDKSYISLKCKQKYLLMVILENYWNKFFSTCTNMVSICVKCTFKGHAIQAAGESDVQTIKSFRFLQCKTDICRCYIKSDQLWRQQEPWLTAYNLTFHCTELCLQNGIKNSALPFKTVSVEYRDQQIICWN